MDKRKLDFSFKLVYLTLKNYLTEDSKCVIVIHNQFWKKYNNFMN